MAARRRGAPLTERVNVFLTLSGDVARLDRPFRFAREYASKGNVDDAGRNLDEAAKAIEGIKSKFGIDGSHPLLSGYVAEMKQLRSVVAGNEEVRGECVGHP